MKQETSRNLYRKQPSFGHNTTVLCTTYEYCHATTEHNRTETQHSHHQNQSQDFGDREGVPQRKPQRKAEAASASEENSKCLKFGFWLEESISWADASSLLSRYSDTMLAIGMRSCMSCTSSTQKHNKVITCMRMSIYYLLKLLQTKAGVARENIWFHFKADKRMQHVMCHLQILMYNNRQIFSIDDIVHVDLREPGSNEIQRVTRKYHRTMWATHFLKHTYEDTTQRQCVMYTQRNDHTSLHI